MDKEMTKRDFDLKYGKKIEKLAARLIIAKYPRDTMLNDGPHDRSLEVAEDFYRIVDRRRRRIRND